jgi:RHS repeat-associated protein
MEKPGRGSNPTRYRFGFNGVEADNALMPGRNSYSFKYRFYDTRTARWTKRDPYTSFYTAFSPYHFAAGNPIVFIDSEGLKIEWANDEQTQKHRKAILRLVNSNQNFAQLYTMLDNMQEIFYVDGGPNGQSKIKEEENKYGNVLIYGLQFKQNIYLAIVADESTYFEEFFHQLQAIAEYHINYEKANSRNAREAEFVLFMSLIGETDFLSSKDREIADSYAYDALQTMRQQIAIEGYISPLASLNKIMQQFTNNFTSFYSSNPIYSLPGIVEQGPVATSEFTKTTFDQNKIDRGYGGSGMGQKHFSDIESIENDSE